MKITVTYIGTATVLIEVGGFFILTDPVFDPPGKRYGFGFGTSSVKTLGPALLPENLPAIDLVLLSHDHHADNLDEAGRRFLPQAKAVLTTPSGAKRLSRDLGGDVTGLKSWEKRIFKTPNGPSVEVHAVPSRHYQRPLVQALVGETTGFVLQWEGQKHGPLYISGDTVYFKGIQEISKRFKIGTAFLHLGGVHFSISGPIRYTLNGAGARKVVEKIQPHTVIPLHYEGWTHFQEKLDDSLDELKKDMDGDKILRLLPGRSTQVEV